MGASGTTVWAAPKVSDMVPYLEGNALIVLNEQDIPVTGPYAGASKRFDSIMTVVTARIRTRIQSFPGMVVSQTVNAIPPELLDIACKLIAVSLTRAFPLLVKITEESVKGWEQEWKEIIDDLRLGRFRISAPVDPQGSDVQAYPSANVSVGRTPVFTLTNPVDGSLGTLAGL